MSVMMATDQRYQDGYMNGLRKARAEAADEIERLRTEVTRLGNCHRIITKQAGFYKPELPGFTKVDIHLEVLRAAARCAGPAPWEDDMALTTPPGGQ